MARHFDVCGSCGGDGPDGCYTLPRCSSCDELTCDACAVPGSVEEHEYDIEREDHTVAVQVITVTCTACRDRDEAENVPDVEAEDAQADLDRRAGL